MPDSHDPSPPESMTTPSPEAHDEARRPQAPDALPMTSTLLARLFVVPALLVTLLVASLMVVVIFFGWPSIGQPASVFKLLDEMDGGTGDRQFGVALFPQNKDVWLAAQELANRLQKRDGELLPEQIEPTAQRLTRIYQRASESATLPEGQRPMLAIFTLKALSLLATPTAAHTLTIALGSPNADLRQAALQGLAEMHDLPASAESVSRIIDLLDDPIPEVRLVACAALGQIAHPDDKAAINALASKLTEDREQQWNSALALGRLGSPRGKYVLMSMLDRAYWERNHVQYVDAGQPVDQPLPPARVEQYLIAAIDASSHVADADLRQAIVALQSDASMVVRQKAISVVKASPEQPASDNEGKALGSTGREGGL